MLSIYIFSECYECISQNILIDDYTDYPFPSR